MNDKTQTINTKAVQHAAQTFATAEYTGASELAKAIGTAPTYALWEETRKAWVPAYIQAREKIAGEAPTLEAGERAWQRQAKALQEFFALEKPKAPTKAATVKADTRKKAQAARDALKKEYPDVASAMRAAQESTEPAKARKLWELVESYKKEADKAAKASETAATKGLRDEVRKLASNGDAEYLKRILGFATFYELATPGELAKYDAILKAQTARTAKPKSAKAA